MHPPDLASTPQPSVAPAARVLVSDDHPITRALIAATLKRAGYQVTLAADATMLLENLVVALTQRAVALPDLIIADVHMEGFNGVAALDLLRQSHWSTPVILTGATRDDAFNLDAPVFSLPLDLEQLLATVQTLVPVHAA